MTRSSCYSDCSSPTLLVERPAAVLEASPEATRLLQSTDALKIENSQLKAAHPQDQAILGSLLAGRQRRPVSLLARSLSGGRALVLRLRCGAASHGDAKVLIDLKHAEPINLVRLRPIALSLGLTDAQQRVLLHLMRGSSNAAIASRLGISQLTVQTHIRNAYARLGICSRNELIGLITRHLFN